MHRGAWQLLGCAIVIAGIFLFAPRAKKAEPRYKELSVEEIVVAGGIVRNRDWVLERSMDAIMAQTFPPEYLYYLTNDNEDRTEEILQNYLAATYDVWNTGYPGYERTGAIRYSSENMGMLRNRWIQKHKNATHWWIVDSDVIPNPDVLERLLALDKPCAGAWVPGCTPNAGWNEVQHRPSRTGAEHTLSGPFRATMLGGSYLLRRDFVEDVGWEPWGKHPQGEDGYLATLAHDRGWEMWADPDAKCQHIMKRDR